MGGWALGAAAMVAATAAATAAVVATSISSSAQKEVAETNARATVQAAKEAANAQIQAAKEDSKARMHQANIDLKQEEMYLEFEEKMAKHQDEQDDYYRQMFSQIDSIDTFYAEDSAWGSGPESAYDYGFDEGVGYA